MFRPSGTDTARIAICDKGSLQSAEQKAHQSSSSGHPQPLAETVLQVAVASVLPGKGGCSFRKPFAMDKRVSWPRHAATAQALTLCCSCRACCQCSKCNLPGPHGTDGKRQGHGSNVRRGRRRRGESAPMFRGGGCQAACDLNCRYKAEDCPQHA